MVIFDSSACILCAVIAYINQSSNPQSARSWGIASIVLSVIGIVLGVIIIIIVVIVVISSFVGVSFAAATIEEVSSSYV